MKPISAKGRLKAGLAIAKRLVENPGDASVRFPSGTVFIPVGVEDGQLIVAVEEPSAGMVESFERVPCIV